MELTGYRAGLKDVVVTAPYVDGYALVSQSMTHTFTELVGNDNTNGQKNIAQFQYAEKGKVTFTLKELKDDGTSDIIQVINGGAAWK